MTEGVDFYSPEALTPAQLVAANRRAVLRYIAPGNPKGATPQEVHGDIWGGVSVGFIFESWANRSLGGAQAGINDGTLSGQWLSSIGAPDGVCAYWAVDFDAQSWQLASIEAYAKGFRQGLDRRYRTGVYGGLYICTALLNSASVDLAWQTLAWSYGQWEPRAVVRQTSITDSIDGVSVDDDWLMAADWGQWVAHGEPAVKPPAAPPAPTVTPTTVEDFINMTVSDPEFAVRFMHRFLLHEDLSDDTTYENTIKAIKDGQSLGSIFEAIQASPQGQQVLAAERTQIGLDSGGYKALGAVGANGTLSSVDYGSYHGALYRESGGQYFHIIDPEIKLPPSTVVYGKD